VATRGKKRWPPAGRFSGRLRGAFHGHRHTRSRAYRLGLLAAISNDTDRASDPAPRERQQPRPPGTSTTARQPRRCSIPAARTWQAPSTVSQELVRSKHYSSSLTGTPGLLLEALSSGPSSSDDRRADAASSVATRAVRCGQPSGVQLASSSWLHPWGCGTLTPSRAGSSYSPAAEARSSPSPATASTRSLAANLQAPDARDWRTGWRLRFRPRDLSRTQSGAPGGSAAPGPRTRARTKAGALRPIMMTAPGPDGVTNP
jgi:hypothetical protein